MDFVFSKISANVKDHLTGQGKPYTTTVEIPVIVCVGMLIALTLIIFSLFMFCMENRFLHVYDSGGVEVKHA